MQTEFACLVMPLPLVFKALGWEKKNKAFRLLLMLGHYMDTRIYFMVVIFLKLYYQGLQEIQSGSTWLGHGM